MEPQSREIAYRALAAELRAAVLAGDYANGRPLPTEAQLAALHGVSRSTVRRAMQDLVADGVIYRVAGRGTFPAADGGRYLRQIGSVEDLMALSLDTECEVIAPLRSQVDIAAAGRLRLDADVVMSLTLRRFFDDLPFVVTTVSLPPAVGALLREVKEFRSVGHRTGLTVIGCIEEAKPRLIVDAEQTITAVPADRDAASQLGCEVGGPVLRVDRLYSGADGQPIELAVSHFNPDYYTYRVRLRRGVS
jgi:GntR family transcriptional regulator